MSILSSIKGPEQVKALDPEDLPKLAEEIREAIIETTSINGGHIGPNLGVVELTIALHRVFSTPRDQFVFDVSHQGYVHKLLTGRNTEAFKAIRGTGLSGFLSREESEHDCYGAGHAGTALSAALGMATARDIRGSDEHVVAIIGDAALTCGITLEALNNIAHSTKRLCVVLNDNEWSIAKNVGAISNYLNELITNPIYNRLLSDMEGFLSRIPGGDSLLKIGAKAKRDAKDLFVPSSLFEKFGLRYIGPIDGHDLKQLEEYLAFCRDAEEPVLLHVLTQKGRGYDIAINNPEKFHGCSPFDRSTGKSAPEKPGEPLKWQDVFGQAMVKFAKKDPRVVGITGAMPSGTGLSMLAAECPKQFFDVGIAEEHAVLFAAGMATKGLRPVVGIYSTFLQRAFDPIVHDVCLQNLPVVFCMDRAGLSANDGPTHHGLFDIAYLSCIPRAILMQPSNEDELVDMMQTAFEANQPAFIRYPRGSASGTPIKDEPAALPIGKAQVLSEGSDIMLWAYGSMVADAMALAKRLEKERKLSVGVVNARFAKPLDTEFLLSHTGSCKMIVTLEDHVITGGFGSIVLEELANNSVLFPVTRIAWPDKFIQHGPSVSALRAANGLSPDDIFSRVCEDWDKVNASQHSVVAGRS